MAPTYPSVDSATLKSLRKGDVSALERIHRAAYPAIVAEATRQGGDASFAPGVVEVAMLQLWENRANIENAEEYEQALQVAVRAGVTREQRRRAAQKESQPAASAGTVDSTWAAVAAAIANGPAVAAPKTGEPRRPAVAKAKSDGGRGAGIVVGVLLIAGAAVGAYYVTQSGEHGVATSSFTLPDAKNIAVTPGQRGNLPLGPGDTSAIGSDTKLTVGGDYGTKVRAAKVVGTTTFHISAGPRFEVAARDASIYTAGPATFAVRAYPDEDAVTVRVKDGEVKVDAGKDSRTLGPGKSVSIAKDGSMSEPSAEAVDQALGWTDGHIAFTNAPLKLVMTEFGRWYDLPVTTKDQSLMTRPVTMSVALESKKDAIAALETNANVKFSYDKDAKPILVDAPAKAAPAKKKGA